MQLTVVFSEEGPENEESVLLLSTDVAKWSYEPRKVLDGKHTTRREKANGFIAWSNYCDRSVRLAFEHVPDLAVSEEELDARLHHVLEDEILVIITGLEDIRIY